MTLQATPKRTRSGDVLHFILIGIGITLIVIAAELGESTMLLTAIGAMIITLIAFVIVATHRSADISIFLLVPTIFSAFQNVFLAPFALDISQTDLQFVIVTNVLYSVVLYVVLAALQPKGLPSATSKLVRTVTWILIVIVLYGFGMMAAFGNNLTAAIASARNLVSPMLFLLIGLLAASWAVLGWYLRLFVALGVGTLAFALFEWLVPGFWPSIGLHNLWERKGIAVTPGSLLPQNFYASEQLIPGVFIRRMAGPFADPVNFGTFLFALLAVSWYLRAWLVWVWAAISVVLTVSKGALLGLLAFVAVWAHRFRSRFEFVVAAGIVAGGALYFYGFTQSSSTGSTTAHINGLLAAFVELPQHPLGRGFGGTGVLANLFSEGSGSGSAILESGIGMVLGQLGIVGLVAYVVFFTEVFRRIRRIDDPRSYVLGMSLLLGFVLNAMFNEVALSPNSSAPYFIIIGLLIGESLLSKNAATMSRETRTALQSVR